MDFVTSHFGKMKLWPVEHFVLTFWRDCYCIQQSRPKVRTNIQLVRGSSFRNDLLQNPYFNMNYQFLAVLGSLAADKENPNCHNCMLLSRTGFFLHFHGQKINLYFLKALWCITLWRLKISKKTIELPLIPLRTEVSISRLQKPWNKGQLRFTKPLIIMKLIRWV